MNKYNKNMFGSGLRPAEQMIEQYNMLEECSHIVIGLSGGADSVCLLLVLMDYIQKNKLQILLHAIHVHHGIRKESADRDRLFCEELCAKYEIAFDWVQVDIPRLARESGQTEEEAGRNARYEIFRKKAEKLGRARIAVAHHMNDQAETIIMNLLRGSSLRGMCGILPVRGAVIRPLLGTTRQEIEAFLLGCGQTYVTDESNYNTMYTRNRIRQEVIPYLEEKINPQVVRRIAEMADSVQEAEEFIQNRAREAYQDCVTEFDENGMQQLVQCLDIAVKQGGIMIDAKKFSQLDRIIGKKVVCMALTALSGAEKDIYRTNIEDVCALFEQQVNKSRSLPYRLSARRTYDGVFIGRGQALQQMEYEQEQFEEEQNLKREFSIDIAGLADSMEIGVPIRVPIEHMIYMGKDGMVFISNIVLELQENVDFSENNDYTKVFDYDKMKGNLVFRFRRDGDRMTVTSDGQTRKLKKEFIDRKIARESRDLILLLAADHMVYWAVGVRRSEDCLVEPTTKRILRVTFE